jgi:predicted alpha-1,6-mannanase (GH76 family)
MSLPIRTLAPQELAECQSSSELIMTMRDGGVSLKIYRMVRVVLTYLAALAWIRAYDLTKDRQYLDTAAGIFEDMLSTGMNATCGGIWWRKAEPKKNTAIANALFISAAAHLANRMTNKSYYYGWAKKNYEWFQQVGYLKDCKIQDSLNVPTSCSLVGSFWTYNQGVILGAMLEMNKAAPDSSLITQARCIANVRAKHSFPDTHDGLLN